MEIIKDLKISVTKKAFNMLFDVEESTNACFSTLCNDDVAVVTGGSLGLGRAICYELVSRGVQRVISLDIVVPAEVSFDASVIDEGIKIDELEQNYEQDDNSRQPETSSFIDPETNHGQKSFAIASRLESLINKDTIAENDHGILAPDSETKKPATNAFVLVDGVEYIRCDVSKIDQVRRAFDYISTTTFGQQANNSPVTILINNAGVMRGKSILDLSDDEVSLSLNVNLLGSFNIIRTFLPGMVQNKRGFIVTVASVLGHLSPAKLSAYGSSKAGVIALHESLTAEIDNMDPKLFKLLDSDVSVALYADKKGLADDGGKSLRGNDLKKLDKASSKSKMLKYGQKGAVFFGKQAVKGTKRVVITQLPISIIFFKLFDPRLIKRNVRRGERYVVRPMKKALGFMGGPENEAIKTLLVCPGQLDTAMFNGVKTPSKLFAPILSSDAVAKDIVNRIEDGEGGSLYMPLYAKFVPLLKGFPLKITKLARWVSGMDKAVSK